MALQMCDSFLQWGTNLTFYTSVFSFLGQSLFFLNVFFLHLQQQIDEVLIFFEDGRKVEQD